ncbi:MAG: PadR family transcriptional regulator [Thermoplasmata archaeon]
MTDFHNFGQMFKRHGSLRYYILWILANEKKRGIDIMEEMEKRSMGFWKPSPGSIYPTLKSLSEEGLIKKNEDGSYELTDKGMDLLGINRGNAPKNKSSNIDTCLDEAESCTDYLMDVEEDLTPYIERIRSIGEKFIKISDQRKGSK